MASPELQLVRDDYAPGRPKLKGEDFKGLRLKDAHDTVQIYTSLLEDLNILDPNLEHNDSKNLVALIRHFIEVPVQVVFDSAQSKYQNKKTMLYEEFNPFSEKVDTIKKKLENLTEGNGRSLSPLSPLELILRVAFYKQRPQKREDDREILLELQVTRKAREVFVDRKMDRAWKREVNSLTSLPLVIFICIGSTMTDVSYHIITTTADSWPNSKILEDWARNSRLSRMVDYEREVVQHLELLFCNNAERGAKDQKRQFIKEEIEAVQGKPWGFDHPTFTGTAFSFPECNYFPRCFKCQALYSFQLPKLTAEVEEQYKKETLCGQNPDLKRLFKNGSCAEALAHLFCARKIAGLDTTQSFRYSAIVSVDAAAN
jgi:hypothetical protein